MRRATITPSSRPSISFQTSQKSRTKPTLSVLINELTAFLSTYNNQTNVENASSKDIQNIFKFIYCLIDKNYTFTNRFEDDAIQILKILKYPNMSEINRSQFIAITPHAYTPVFYMLKWLSQHIMPINEDLSLNLLFFNFCCRGYVLYLEGSEIEDNEFVDDVNEHFGNNFVDIERKIKELNDIEKEDKNTVLMIKNEDIPQRKGTSDKESTFDDSLYTIADYHNLIKEMENEIQSINERKKQNIEKIKKTKKSEEKYKEENNELEIEIENIQKQINSVNEEIKKQKINPEDIKRMNDEKVEMYNSLESMRPEKEKLMKEVNEYEKIIKEKNEEIERLLIDLDNIKYHNEKQPRVKYFVDKNYAKLSDNFYKNAENIETMKPKINQEILDLENDKINLNLKIMEQQTTLLELNDQNKHLDGRLISVGKLYLEKKEIGAIEKRKNLDELNKVEGELMKLNLETNHALLLSEQRLEQAMIKKERFLNSLKREKEEIESCISMLEKLFEEKFEEVNEILNST